MTVYAMAITHHEEMETCLTKQVGSERICVLIDFVRIAGLVTSRSSESKLCYRIESFRLFICTVFVLIQIFFLVCLRSSIVVKNIGDCIFAVILTSVAYSFQIS